MSYGINFAATQADWQILAAKTGMSELLRFYPTDVFSLADVVPKSLDEIVDPANLQYGIRVADEHYIAIPVDQKVFAREIRQTNGVIRYSVDSGVNLDSFRIFPGGLWKDDFFIASLIDSLHNTGIAAGIARKIRGQIGRHYAYIGHYRASPECHRLYANRTFTSDYRSPV